MCPESVDHYTKIDDDFYITDWFSGQLLRITKTGFSVVISGLKNPTDPNYAEDLGVLAIPEHGTNRVLFIKLPIK